MALTSGHDTISIYTGRNWNVLPGYSNAVSGKAAGSGSRYTLRERFTMLDPGDVRDQVQVTTLHQVLVLDGVLQTLRRRLEEDMPMQEFGHLICTVAELEGQLLQWTRALMQWIAGESAFHDAEDE